ncbi:MAG: recombinase family protein [Bacteroidota bacterium]
MHKPKPVALWIRVSTDDQAKGESPEHHEKRARMYAEMKGWEVITVYRLEGFSGKSVMEYPETKRMLHDIKQGNIKGLIFSKLARLARNTKELLEFADYFQEYDADLISLQEAIDTSSPAGRLFYTIIAAMAEWERAEISDRVKASVPIRAKMGKSLGGAAPFGYKWVDKKLELDEKEAPIRKLLFEAFLENRTKKGAAKILNEQGFRTRNGANFTNSSVTRLLRDPIAKGMRRMNYTKSLGKDKPWEMKPQEDWIFVPAPAIVSEEVWDTVNHILDERKLKHKRVSRRVAHLFTGIARCHCGGVMYVPSNHPKYTCRTCKNKIGEQDLEDIFHEQLRAFMVSKESIQQHLSQSQQEIITKENLIANLQTEAKSLQQRMDTLMDLVQTGEIPKSGFSTYYQPIHEQLSQIRATIPELQGEIDSMKVQMNSSDHILHEAKDLHARWYDLTFEEKRSIIETVVERVTVGEGDLEFNLLYLPTTTPFSPLNSLQKGNTPSGIGGGD